MGNVADLQWATEEPVPPASPAVAVDGPTTPVEVPPAGCRPAAPPPQGLAQLAAHVRPGDPAVRALVAEATDLLEAGTGSGSMSGWADDAERVDEVVEALTWAVRRREVRYQETVAGGAGRSPRTPGEVLDGRVGTSLDLVLTLAAAFEQAGLRPLLWLVPEHAFLGYWREERSTEAAATTDVTALVDLVDRGRIGLVETRLLTDRGNTSADLHGPAYSAWLTGDLTGVLGVTDVHRARHEGIEPLPSRTDDVPTEDVPTDDAPEVGAADEPARSPLQRCADTLLDLTRRNPLVDLPARAGLPLTVPQTALPVLEDLLGAGATLTLLPGDRVPGLHVEPGPRPAGELPAEQLTALLAGQRAVHVALPEAEHLPRLRALAHDARTVVEETGANDLYLALGTLVWELDGRPVRSPLVLVPVVLSTAARGGGHRLTADESGTPRPNDCLRELLRRRHGLDVPGLDTPSADGTGIDLTAALHAVRAAVAERSLPWRVEPTAELAVLPLTDVRLWQDLDASGADLAEHPLVAALTGTPDEFVPGPVPATAEAVDLDELAARCPLPADATQLQAIAEGTAGHTFVLEGPPGTGKTQTIANLVTHAVAEGRRVLVVAGKRAALDGLARRLDAVGMGPITLDLHARGSRPAVVRAQVRTALAHAVDVDEQGLAADAEDLASATRTLARYAERLHAENPCGLSFSSAHEVVLAADADVPVLPVTPAFAARADADVVTAVRRALALLPEIAGLARPSAGHAWGFIDTIDLDITAVQQAAVAVDTAVRELPGGGGLAAAVRAVRSVEDLDTLVHLLTGPRVTLDVLDEVRSPRWAAATADVTGEIAALTGAVHPALETVTPDALALPLADLVARAQTAAATGWWGRRGTLADLRAQLEPVLKPGATVRTKDLPALLESLGRLQAAVHAVAARAVTIPGLQVPAGWNPFLDSGRFVLDAEVRWLRRAASAVDGSTVPAAALRRFLAGGPVADAGAARTIARLRDAVVTLLTACSSNSAQLAAWSGTDGLALRWTMTRPERGVEYVHPMSLRRWVSLLDTLEPLRLAGLTEARAQLRHGVVRADDAVRAFDRGLAEASVAERLTTTGLDAFDAGLHESVLSRFTAASRAVRSHLTSAVPAAVLAARPSGAAGDQRVAALQRELAEHRRGPGVRDLLATDLDLVTAVLPCVLATPDSVSRLLPAAPDLFDLVVFDEASRLRVTDAVGALGRARAAVVVGDGQQLRPGDGREDLLSACVRAGVPRRSLSWHYRSRDERLIAFSNTRYYDDRLATFPAPGHRPSPISLVQVDGALLRSGPEAGTNPVEARAVVAEVVRRFAAGASSLGVVTLHAAQRALVETLLREAGDERVTEALDRLDGEGLFVKQLADVQGDERDVVVLSTGAAPAAGRWSADLGPLARDGGERWLNVAVTRARQQVVVVSSFAPEQLPPDDGTALGVAHLRGYLEAAARGADALLRPTAVGARDRHRDQVAAELRERGLVVRTDVGLSDFRIDLTVARAAAPDVPLLAVLLDGPAWARRRTVGDRDGLPVEVLGELVGWPAVERVWLPAWLADRDEVLDRLVAAVDAVPVADEPAPEPEPAYDGPLADVIPLRPAPTPEPVVPEPLPEPLAEGTPPAEPVVATSTPSAEPVVAEGVTSAEPVVARSVPLGKATPSVRRATVRPVAEPLDEEQPFVPWSPRPAGEKKQLDQLADPAVAKVVRRVLAAGLKAEGPVHRDRLTRLTAGAFGLTRVAEARRDALLGLLPRTAVVDGEFVWPAGTDRETWTWFRRQTSSAQRPLEHVPPVEIGNAMAALARAAGGLTEDELGLRTLEVFGSRRRTPAQLPLLQAGLAAAVARGRLTAQPDGRFTT
ncbi:DUF4011 domain-containing protein [Modestobacter altitudinis]|uniref:DUF4011 domain-containing protein n=1 Tax=Modestobacter altitudinis TaxID=2213158 RepID=UPI00110C9030|nr:DUF4011 domain-containing protein [Modestobacter altitudinis]